MEEKDIKIIQTTQGELRYYRDWKMDGGIVMLNPKTINRYKRLKDEHPDTDKYAVFFAFSNQQLAEGVKKLKDAGFIKSEDELRSYGSMGLIGTQKGITDFLAFYEERDKRIPKECDPQEVYFYEYNNHECQISWEGDKPAFDLVVSYFGQDIANSINRIN